MVQPTESSRESRSAPTPPNGAPQPGPSSNHGVTKVDDLPALAEFRYVIRRFLAASERMAQQTGLTPQQHQLLLAIQGRPSHAAPTIGYLAERLLIKHHSAVGLIDRLADEGLVIRETDPADRRQVLVRLTERGLTMLGRLSSAHRQEIRSLAPRLIEALGAIIESHGEGTS